jgi:hypothetical protein
MQLEMPVPRAPFQPPHREPLPEYGEEIEAPDAGDGRRGKPEGGDDEQAVAAEANTVASIESEQAAPGPIVSTSAVEDLPPPAEFPVAGPPAIAAEAVEAPVRTPAELQETATSSESSAADDFGAGLPGVVDAPDVSNV